MCGARPNRDPLYKEVWYDMINVELLRVGISKIGIMWDKVGQQSLRGGLCGIK